jgi:diacylglycerol kinase family enzyme
LLARAFTQAGRRHSFVPVAKPQQLEQASRRAAAEAALCGGVLVAVGGDGTINTVAQAAWSQGCALGVIPGGTFNYFARSHAIPQEHEAAAAALLRAQPEPVQVGEVDGRLFLVNASLGLYPQLLQDREAFKQQFGRHRWVAVLSGLVTLFEWRRQLVLEIELDGQRSVLTTPTLFVGNNRLQLRQVGIEEETACRVGEGRLAAIVARPIGTLAMMGLMLRGAFGRLGDADQVQSFAFRSLTVQARRMRRLKLAADGEVGVATPPLRFAVSATPLMLMLPREEDRVPVE